MRLFVRRQDRRASWTCSTPPPSPPPSATPTGSCTWGPGSARSSSARNPDAWRENDRLRAEASRVLVDAAIAAGAALYVQPTVTFVYPPQGPVDDDDAIWRRSLLQKDVTGPVAADPSYLTPICSEAFAGSTPCWRRKGGWSVWWATAHMVEASTWQPSLPIYGSVYGFARLPQNSASRWRSSWWCGGFADEETNVGFFAKAPSCWARGRNSIQAAAG
jgi:hypothetical protein